MDPAPNNNTLTDLSIQLASPVNPPIDQQTSQLQRKLKKSKFRILEEDRFPLLSMNKPHSGPERGLNWVILGLVCMELIRRYFAP